MHSGSRHPSPAPQAAPAGRSTERDPRVAADPKGLARDASTLRADPAALRDAWRTLRAQHPHLHGPEAAARLGVPEAALVASRIGDGACALDTDLAALLSGCAGWGKLLFAARNAMGVAIIILDDATEQPAPGRLSLRTSAVEAVIDTQAAASAFLFEDRDAHGHTVSVNWFDAHGDVLGRLFLMAKSGRARALPHLQRFVRQTCDARGSAPDGGSVATLHLPHPPRRVQAISDPTPEVLAERVVLGCATMPRWRVALCGPGAAVRYDGPLGRPMHTPPAVHATDALCKLHLRMAAARSAWWCAADDGAPGIEWADGEGGTLSFTPRADSDATAQWAAALNDGGTR